eukprot:gene30084-36335_t
MFSSAMNSDEDHLYDFNSNLDSGYGTAPGTSAAFNKQGLNTAFRPVGTAAQRPPISTAMGRNNPPMSRGGVSRNGLTTGMAGGGSSEARPMTSVSGAGYKSSVAGKDNKSFDPLNMGRGPAPPLAEKSDNSHEEKAKEMEKKVHRLIEATAEALQAKDALRALEKAKEAGKAERALCKFKESHNLAEQINAELTYAICFNLANAYHANKMYEEALNTYNLIVKNKQYSQSGRLRVNMGNIYYEQKQYPQAIKMYRMALDQVPSTHKELRYRIIRNIGNAFVKLRQFQDAIENYETIMSQGAADIQSAFNLLLCLYARGDKDKIRKHFMRMLSIPIPGMTEDDEERANEQTVSVDAAVEKEDMLRSDLTQRFEMSNERILTSARLVAPLLDEKPNSYEGGYKWVFDQLRSDYESVMSKLELDLSMMHMKRRRFEDAITLLKSFEKKAVNLRTIAATNLSFIYFLEGDYQQAERHADIAIKADRYNAKALVNKGNCLFVQNELSRAREMFLEAVGVEADCIEAIYNLGLVNMRLNNIAEAQSAFDKLNTSLPSMPETLYQLGLISYRSNTSDDLENAAKTFQLLLNKVPGDPNICCKLGAIYEKLGDDNTACHWYTEAFRHYPVNLQVISWLGVWYVKREMYEQAISYFEKASLVQPGEIKWQLMVTSCYRRLGDLYKALELYQKIHEQYPDNIEALQYLEALCKDLGRAHDEYSKKLEKLRRTQVQTQSAAPQTTQANTQQRQQDTQRPARTERTARPERGNNNNQNTASRAIEELEDSPTQSHLVAPRVGGGAANKPASNVRSNRDDDDFGDTDVTSLLM